MVADTYNLNLSHRYAPNWTAWEVAREIICNAMDADPGGLEISSPDRNTLVVTTTTAPRLSDIFVIGGGSKNIGGETIGQFGEGMKMAALVATRDGSGMTVNIPGHEISFEFRELMGESVLHADIRQCLIPGEGMTVTVKMPGIQNAYAGKLVFDQPEGPVGTAHAGMKIYCKGVYISAIANESIWDWNLKSLKVNRDRSMVETSSITTAIAGWLSTEHTPEICDLMVSNPGSLESSSSNVYFSGGKSLHKELADAFKRKHGQNVCVRSDDSRDNARSRRAGLNPVSVSEPWFARCIVGGGIPLASDTPQDDFDFESIDSTKYADQIADLKRLAEIVGAPEYTLGVFANRDVSTMGFARIKDRQIWIREAMFQSDDTARLMGVFLHELAHIMSGAEDGSRAFEYALTEMLGQLAERL